LTQLTAIYTLSLHDALPISGRLGRRSLPRRLARDPAAGAGGVPAGTAAGLGRLRRPPARPAGRPGAGSRRLPVAVRRTGGRGRADRKSTRLNSSHVKISYAV